MQGYKEEKIEGGVGIHVHGTYNFKERTDLAFLLMEDFESVFVYIETANFEKTQLM